MLALERKLLKVHISSQDPKVMTTILTNFSVPSSFFFFMFFCFLVKPTSISHIFLFPADIQDCR